MATADTAERYYGEGARKVSLRALAATLGVGKSLPDLCRLLPIPVLGALLIYIGVQHALLARDILDSSRESAVVAAIGVATLVTGNLAVAFGGGILLNGIVARLPGRSVSRSAEQDMSPREEGLRDGAA